MQGVSTSLIAICGSDIKRLCTHLGPDVPDNRSLTASFFSSDHDLPFRLVLRQLVRHVIDCESSPTPYFQLSTRILRPLFQCYVHHAGRVILSAVVNLHCGFKLRPQLISFHVFGLRSQCASGVVAPSVTFLIKSKLV